MYRRALPLVFLGFCSWACNQNKISEEKKIVQPEVALPQSESLEMSIYEESMITQGLVDVQALDQSIRVDLKYSSNDNFFGYDVYGTLELAYLQKEVAEALVKAQQNLKKKHPKLSLLIYDAARPLSIQEVLWEELDSLPRQERKKYVADPEEVSLHNLGCAVDLTIFDEETGKPLDMGTPFDYFGEKAYPRLEKQMINEGKLNLKQLNNRILLRNLMIEVGFMPITSEWWHFNFHSRAVAKTKYRVIP